MSSSRMNEMSISRAYAIADERMDAGDRDAGLAITYCAAVAEIEMRVLQKLTFAVTEKSARKRHAVLAEVIAELDASGVDTAGLQKASL